MYNVEYILGGRWQVAARAQGLSQVEASAQRDSLRRCGFITRVVRAWTKPNRMQAVAQRAEHERPTLPAPAFVACKAAALREDVELSRRETTPAPPRPTPPRKVRIPRPPRIPSDALDIPIDVEEP